jgi:pyruvate,water dikinase
MFTRIESSLGIGVGIEAVYGLGEGLVSGLLQPDRYFLEPAKGDLVHSKIASKPIMLYPNPSDQKLVYGDAIMIGGDEHVVIRDEKFSHTLGVMVNEAWQEQETLSPEQLAQLFYWAQYVEKAFAAPQDIEWAITAEGQIYLLQTRPITVPAWWNIEQNSGMDAKDILCGNSASPGVARGRVRILSTEDSGSELQDGEVLVTFQTYPKWFFAMSRSAAIVTQVGGILCHAAIVARELGKPCVTGVFDVMECFKNGDMIEVDGTRGQVFASQEAHPEEELPTPVSWPSDSYWDVPGDETAPMKKEMLNPIAVLHWTLMETGWNDRSRKVYEQMSDRIGLVNLKVLPCDPPVFKHTVALPSDAWKRDAMAFIQDFTKTAKAREKT